MNSSTVVLVGKNDNKYMLDISSHLKTSAIVEVCNYRKNFALVKSEDSSWEVMCYRLVNAKFKHLINQIYEQWPTSLSQKAVATLEKILCLKNLNRNDFLFYQHNFPNTNNYFVSFLFKHKMINLSFEQSNNQLNELVTKIKIGKFKNDEELPIEVHYEKISDSKDFFSFFSE